jgi:hypothetical protein
MIKLTKVFVDYGKLVLMHDGEIYINRNLVNTLELCWFIDRPEVKWTRVSFDSYEYNVTETPEQILAMIPVGDTA